MTKIVFTGGGSAGHVVPNLPLIQKCQQAGWQVNYIGSYDGIERDILTSSGVRFYPIMNGRLRRYLSIKNIFAPFLVIIGILQAWLILLKLRPRLVFSKGGYVSFPVVFAAWLHRIPAFAHESDLTPGLSNRLSFPFIQKLFITFEQGKSFYQKRDRIVVTGTPLREALFKGDRERAREILAFSEEKPVLLVMGGGLGSHRINQTILQALESLCGLVNIIHLTGANKKVEIAAQYLGGYRAFECVYGETMADYFAYADYVVSRAGANTLYELAALQKPHLLIPLSKQASRGDQLDNARYFQRLGFSEVLEEEALCVQAFLEKVQHLLAHGAVYREAMRSHPLPNAVDLIFTYLQQVLIA